MKVNWKKLFLGLLILNILVVGVLVLLINLPVKDEPITKSKPSKKDYIGFKIETNKADLNEVINHFIEKELKNGSVDYQVKLDKEVELYGTFPFFSQSLEMKLTFKPEAQKNGDIVLKQQSMSLGQLELPASYVMKFVRDSYKLPKWVVIQPDKQLVYVQLENMKLKNDMKVKVEKFDLEKDQITLDLLVPTKKDGQ